MSWYNPTTWGQTGSTAPLQGEQQTADQTAAALAAQRAALGPNPTAINTQTSGQDRTQQEQAIQALQGAAAGTTASPAELQERQQAANNNASAFGAAAALKGRTPGASFTAAARQNAENQLQTDATAATLRASETAAARTALSGAVATQEQQDQQGAQAQAGLKTNYDTSLLGGSLTSQGQGVTAAGGQVNANVANAQTQNSFTGGILGGAGSVGVAALSDERTKKDISEASPEELEKALAALRPKTFEYKDPDQPGAGPGLRVGVMAQDLQKSPLGRETVVDGSPLKVDLGNAMGLALAGLAAANKRIEALEGKKRGK